MSVGVIASVLVRRIISYSAEGPLGFKDHHDEGRQEQRHSQHAGAQLPGYLTLSGPRVPPSHDGDDVERREYVEYLEEEIPDVVFVENVSIPGAEDYGV